MIATALDRIPMPPVAKLLAKTRYKSSTTARNLRTVEKLLTD